MFKRLFDRRKKQPPQTDIPTGLQAILAELSQPPRSLLDMPRRVELCRQALALVSRAEDAPLWAALQGTLADSLAQNLQGSRAENLEQAIGHFQQALEVNTRQAMPVQWAQTMNNLATAYSDRIRGERAENIEQAIKHYRQTLEVMTRQAMPIKWATTMMNLATAYRNRIRGERAENIEQAIEHYRQALEVMTRQAMPVEWATTMNNLANAYSNRVRGERAENIEQAIGHFQQALEVRTRQAMPVQWATTMMNLAAVYYSRIRGERAENIEQAIGHFQQALEVRTRKAMPIEWAQTVHNLALAYLNRIRGERAENLEQAIEHYRQALEVRTRRATPIEWATTMNNLANAYADRIRGERAENIEQAIEHLEQALEVMTRQAMPIEWAEATMNLATIYSNRIRGERAENIEQAIGHFQQVLEVTTRQAMPVEWAEATMNLASAYRNRIKGEQAENIEQAIELYQQALEVRTREAMPVEWAQTMMGLANAYRNRIRGERAENIEQAITAYEQALEIQTIEQFPADYQKTNRNLGHLHFGEQDWVEAHTAYWHAIEAEKILLAAAYTETGQRAEIAETAQLYAHSAYALLQLDEAEEALAQLERGKIRLLAQTLALAEADLTILPKNQQETLRTLREALRNLEDEMRLPPDTPVRRDDRTLARALQQTRERLNQAIEAIRVEHPDFMPSGLEVPAMLALIPPNGALVAPLVTSQGSAVFVVPHGAGTVTDKHVIWLDDFTDDDLQTMLCDPAQAPEWGGWLGAYFNRRSNPDGWFDTIETTGQALWNVLMQPVHQRLATLGLSTGAPVLLMPQGGLGLLPLHAAWREVNGDKWAFLDDYQVTYAPNGYAFSVSRRRLQKEERHQRTLLAVVNPTKDLTYTPVEGEQIVKLFGENVSHALTADEATPTAVRQALSRRSYLHFSCHGFYAWGEVMQSGLLLAGGKPLTLAHIIGNFNLDATRLVTLSACETGLTEFWQSPDEYLGLPAGFLQAGAPGVVSTLWAVDDLSTMLLMERFYQHHLQDKMEIAEALRQAQLWLREVTAGELADRFSAEREAIIEGSSQMPAEVVSEQFRRFATLAPDDRPFARPYYWAAFTFSGV